MTKVIWTEIDSSATIYTQMQLYLTKFDCLLILCGYYCTEFSCKLVKKDNTQYTQKKPAQYKNNIKMSIKGDF